MAHKKLHVVLHDLEVMARKHLPTMADIYGAAHRAAQQAHATRLPSGFPNPPSKTVEDAFNELQQTVEHILQETQANLADAADALKATAREYEESDRLNAKAFKELMDDYPPTPEAPGHPGK